MEKIVKIGTVEMYESRAEELWQEAMYVMTYSKIYKVEWDKKRKRFYGKVVFSHKPVHGIGITKRGRYNVGYKNDVDSIIEMLQR